MYVRDYHSYWINICAIVITINMPIVHLAMELKFRFELKTCGLQDRCSTNWAIPAYLARLDWIEQPSSVLETDIITIIPKTYINTRQPYLNSHSQANTVCKVFVSALLWWVYQQLSQSTYNLVSTTLAIKQLEQFGTEVKSMLLLVYYPLKWVILLNDTPLSRWRKE